MKINKNFNTALIVRTKSTKEDKKPKNYQKEAKSTKIPIKH